jgi:hypothetical protein
MIIRLMAKEPRMDVKAASFSSAAWSIFRAR